MDSKTLDFYFMQNGKYFSPSDAMMLRQRMEGIDDFRFNQILSVQLRDPTTILVVAVLWGELGIDSFLLGKIGRGVLKLLTVGLCGVLWIVDIFKAKEFAYKHNLSEVSKFLF